ncbi:MAG: hypothetical protein RLZZ69_236, partial [Cyanobacteriota bacterium]
LIRDGVLLEAMSEERLSRAKKHSGFPHLALKYIIKKYSIDKVQLVTVVGHTFSPIYKKTKKENLEERARSRFSDDFIRALGARFPLIGSVIKARYVVLETIRNSGMESFIKKDIQSRFPGAAVSYIEHHHAHAWCAPLFVDNATDKKITEVHLDQKTYSWKNEKRNISERCTAKELGSKYGIRLQYLNTVIQGKVKCSRGWSLVKSEAAIS